MFGGNCAPACVTCTETYDGTAWSGTGALITARQNLAGSGTQGAALAFGGRAPAGTGATEKFNGTSWSTANSMIVARSLFAGGTGTQTATLAFGGYNFPSLNNAACSECYNGTTWSTTNPLITGRTQIAGAGTTPSVLAFGGTLGGGGVACTEAFNGTSWSTASPLITARYGAGAGIQSSALMIGGASCAPMQKASTCTEKFNGSTWTAGNALIGLRGASSGKGTSSATAFVAGGWNNSSNPLNTAEKILSTAATFSTFNYSADSGTTTVSSLVETSAQRYKDNIKPLASQLEKLKQLNPVEFDWKTNQKHDIGFIAEEVQQVYPEVVNVNAQGEVEGLSYSKLGAALTKAVQEQQTQIQAQQVQIELLLTEINNLKNK